MELYWNYVTGGKRDVEHGLTHHTCFDDGCFTTDFKRVKRQHWEQEENQFNIIYNIFTCVHTEHIFLIVLCVLFTYSVWGTVFDDNVIIENCMLYVRKYLYLYLFEIGKKNIKKNIKSIFCYWKQIHNKNMLLLEIIPQPTYIYCINIFLRWAWNCCGYDLWARLNLFSIHTIQFPNQHTFF